MHRKGPIVSATCTGYDSAPMALCNYNVPALDLDSDIDITQDLAKGTMVHFIHMYQVLDGQIWKTSGLLIQTIIINVLSIN